MRTGPRRSGAAAAALALLVVPLACCRESGGPARPARSDGPQRAAIASPLGREPTPPRALDAAAASGPAPLASEEGVEGRATADRRVAVTIDDLPVARFARYRDDAHRLAVVRSLTALVRERRLPVTGFVIGADHQRQPGLMPLWIEAGIGLGNHTWSHPRLRKVGPRAFLTDLERGHAAVLRMVPPGTPVPFRYPYLYQGFAPEERDAVRRRLAELGSRPAPITVETNDWLYSDEYTEAGLAGDRERARRALTAWRWDLEEGTEQAEWRARELFGREPPQILLVHANELAADHLGGYLDWLVARGYRFVGLDEALADPAYSEPDDSLVLTGDSHWLAVRRSRQLRGER